MSNVEAKNEGPPEDFASILGIWNFARLAEFLCQRANSTSDYARHSPGFVKFMEQQMYIAAELEGLSQDEIDRALEDADDELSGLRTKAAECN